MDVATDPVIADAISAVRTQRELSRRTGLSQQFISKLLYRTRVPSAETAMKIEKATEGVVSKSRIRPDIWPEVIAS